MKEPLRIFVAGPYCAYNTSEHDAPRIAQKNVDRAICIANALADKGHFVFVPHLQHYMHIHNSCIADRGFWYNRCDMSFLRIWANCLFYIGDSPGALHELSEAITLGYIIYRSVEMVPTFEKED
jgi:hypothetical protein